VMSSEKGSAKRAARLVPLPLTTFADRAVTSAFDAVDGAHSEASECHRVEALKQTTMREPSMGEVITVGLDIAKSVFQVHGVDEGGGVVLRKRISRAKMLEFFAGLELCLVGIEACPAAHHWGRELQALGHTVKLMPPSYVKAYLKRSKNDANDAAAICEAVTRPSMRFVAIKTKEQQAALMLHRARQLLVRQRTMLSNAIRGHLAELGIVSAKGRTGTGALLAIIADTEDSRVPPMGRGILEVLARQYTALDAELGSIDRSIVAWHR